VKNSGLGFGIPYIHNGEPHDYVPDFIVRLKATDKPLHLILETKGYDTLAEVKRAAAERWVTTVNADGQFGQRRYKMVSRPEEVPAALDAAV
jgi:type III restriction enzyme